MLRQWRFELERAGEWKATGFKCQKWLGLDWVLEDLDADLRGRLRSKGTSGLTPLVGDDRPPFKELQSCRQEVCTRGAPLPK